MKIVARYDFNSGLEEVSNAYAAELDEIAQVIAGIDADTFLTKVSKEKTMTGKMLYSPSELNEAMKLRFSKLNWAPKRVACDYSIGEFLPGYKPSTARKSTSAFREMDFIKRGKKLGVEVQFGKYAFMVYNVCAKMTIFKNLGHIDMGVEIVPVKRFADRMSTGVSYFEQFAWDLKHRGVSDIDIPVLILGIDK